MLAGARKLIGSALLVAVPAAVSLQLACMGSSEAVDGSDDSFRSSSAQRRFPLTEMQTSTVEINGQNFRVWLALTDEEHTEGLMHVPESEIGDDQGMLFVFPDEQVRSFWMRNTITSLDIAFARADGRIVKIHTMPPLTLQTFPSVEPAMFALEVKAGTVARLSRQAGDTIRMTPDVFTTPP